MSPAAIRRRWSVATNPRRRTAVETRLQQKIGTRDAPRVQMHANQLTVSAGTVRVLADEQFPQWRSLPIRSIASRGTVNAIVRFGEELAARFPLKLKPGDSGVTRCTLELEAEAGRELAGRTRFPTPEPVALGESARHRHATTTRCPAPSGWPTWPPSSKATLACPAK